MILRLRARRHDSSSLPLKWCEKQMTVSINRPRSAIAVSCSKTISLWPSSVQFVYRSEALLDVQVQHLLAATGPGRAVVVDSTRERKESPRGLLRLAGDFVLNIELGAGGYHMAGSPTFRAFDRRAFCLDLSELTAFPASRVSGALLGVVALDAAFGAVVATGGDVVEPSAVEALAELLIGLSRVVGVVALWRNQQA